MSTKSYDCKAFQEELPDLVLEPGRTPSAEAATHMTACAPCSEEYLSYQETFAVLNGWTVPQPTAYFDQKMAVRLREERAAPRMGWLERLATSLSLNTGRSVRPVMAGALSLVMLASAGGIYEWNQPGPQPAPAMESASATVNDLQILDRNDQAFQQMDMIEQDERQATPTPQQDAPIEVPAS